METAKEKRFGFSWADEVEREEQAEQEQVKDKEKENEIPTQIQKEKEIQNTRRRTKPFGVARPREVIGVDWRKIDEEFDFNSSSTFRASNKPMEINKKNPLPLQNSKIKNLPTEEFAVPPLKYPPKNINLVFEAIRKSRKDKSNTNPNFMPRQKAGTENSTMVHRPVLMSNLDSVFSSNSNDVKKESIPVPKFEKQSKDTKRNSDLIWVRKEKTESNYKRKSDDGGEIVERKALVDLNSKFEKKPNCEKKTQSSNSYFGVLDLLEQSSEGKSANLKKRIKK